MRKSRRIPNFRNLGIHLRVLVLHLCMLGALALWQWPQAENVATLLAGWMQACLHVLPPLLLSLGALSLLYPAISRWPYVRGLAVMGLLVLLLTLLTAAGQHLWVQPLATVDWLQAVLFCFSDTALCLYYLDLLQRAYSPAIAEARLQALQARIRPHFLFNSLNAVLSLIRSQPQRAEAALEDMAELFRVLMADNRALVPLAQEVQLCRQYLNIEALRLGERLQCVWQMPQVLPQVMLPPLILQPLLENAVYHGIELLAEGGVITVAIKPQGNSVLIRISNPLPEPLDKAAGNKMALKNIRERLRLHYDLEASFRQFSAHQQYVVEISLPGRMQTEVDHD